MIRHTHIVRTGEYGEIILPPDALRISGLEGTILITVEKGRIILERERKVREGWAEMFAASPADDGDRLLDDVPLSSFDLGEEWRWE